MDPGDNEQTELLRSIWNQIKDLDHNLGGRIDATNARIDRTNQELAGVKQEVAGVKQEVAGVKQEVAGVKQEVAELRGEVKELRGDVFDLKVEVKAVRVASQGTFELLARADKRHEGDIEELRTRIERVEQHVGLREPG